MISPTSTRPPEPAPRSPPEPASGRCRGPAAPAARRAVARNWRRLPPAALMLGALLAIWIVWYPHSPDLAAQAYRTHLFSVNGFTLWDNNWYAGHYLLDYSVLFPPLGALLGLRAVGAIAVCLSTVMFARLAREHFGARARPPPRCSRSARPATCSSDGSPTRSASPSPWPPCLPSPAGTTGWRRCCRSPAVPRARSRHSSWRSPRAPISCPTARSPARPCSPARRWP